MADEPQEKRKLQGTPTASPKPRPLARRLASAVLVSVLTAIPVSASGEGGTQQGILPPQTLPSADEVYPVAGKSLRKFNFGNDYANATAEEIEAIYQSFTKGRHVEISFFADGWEGREKSSDDSKRICADSAGHLKNQGDLYDLPVSEMLTEEAKRYCELGYSINTMKDRTNALSQIENEATLGRLKALLAKDETIPGKAREVFEEFPPIVTTEASNFFALLSNESFASLSLGTNHIRISNLKKMSKEMKTHFVLHEMMHYISFFYDAQNIRWRDEDGTPHVKGSGAIALYESNNELQTQRALARNGVHSVFFAYPQGFAALCAIETLVGEETLREAFFKGDYTEVARKLDTQLGKGSFEKIASNRNPANLLLEFTKAFTGRDEGEAKRIATLIPIFSKTDRGPFGIGKVEFDKAEEVARFLIEKEAEDKDAVGLAGLFFFFRSAGTNFRGEPVSIGIAKEAYDAARWLGEECLGNSGLLHRTVRILGQFSYSKKSGGAVWQKEILEEALSIARWEIEMDAHELTMQKFTDQLLIQTLFGAEIKGLSGFIKKTAGEALLELDTPQQKRYAGLYLNIAQHPEFKTDRANAALLLAAKEAIENQPQEEDWAFRTIALNGSVPLQKVFSKKYIEELRVIARFTNNLEQSETGFVGKIDYILENPGLGIKDIDEIKKILAACDPEEEIKTELLWGREVKVMVSGAYKTLAQLDALDKQIFEDALRKKRK